MFVCWFVIVVYESLGYFGRHVGVYALKWSVWEGSLEWAVTAINLQRKDAGGRAGA